MAKKSKTPKARLDMATVHRLRQGGRHADRKKVANKKAARGRSFREDY